MSFGPVYTSPIARSVPFDNSANGFAAIEIQAAIEESTKRLVTTQLSQTGLVSTTSSAFAPVSGMSLTPTTGTYVLLFTAFFYTSGVNTQGEVILRVGGVEVAHSRRIQYDDAAILGLVTLSTNQGGSSATIAAQFSVNGSQAVEILFRSATGGTTYIRERTLLLIQVAP